MSTRAVYSFLDDYNKGTKTINIYKHTDGYPTGAADHIRAALPYAWHLPRFEADEFAGAFIAAAKQAQLEDRKKFSMGKYAESKLYDLKGRCCFSGGDIRVFPSGDPRKVVPKNAADAEYRYEIRCIKGKLQVKAFVANLNSFDEPLYREEQIYDGSLEGFTTWAKKEEVAPFS